jgi:hypothetical protein
MRAFVIVVTTVIASTAVGAQRSATPPTATIVAKFSGPLLAVSRLITEDKWSPVLDRTVQEAPAARSLGAAWKNTDPRWQKARQLLDARVVKIFVAYSTANQVAKHIEADLALGRTPADLEAISLALNGPAGAAIVRYEANAAYVVSVMTAEPGGPAVSSPEWFARMRELRTTFDARVGSALPKDDGSQTSEVQRLLTGPMGQHLSRLGSSVVSNATRQLDTAINLMLFDDRTAIERDIANAIAGR